MVVKLARSGFWRALSLADSFHDFTEGEIDTV